ncbi:MAG: coproporphyrinogen-III oxidase family protein [bacterium]
MTNYEKIIKLIMSYDPSTWWAEYPPKFAYKNNIINKSLVKRSWQKVFKDKITPISVYINIPFCKKRCFFCKYYSEIGRKEEKMSYYLDCLDKELSLYGVDFKKKKIDSLYIGGGTPTLLNEKLMQKLFNIIHSHFRFDSKSQIAIEGTPESLNYRKLKLLKSLGVDRLTIGIQSFDDNLLKKVNRGHTARDIYNAYKYSLKAGIRNINFDILLELPDETKKSYSKTLKGLLDLKPDCISFMTLAGGKRLKYNPRDLISSLMERRGLKNKMFPEMVLALKKKRYKFVEGFSGMTLVKSNKKNLLNKGLVNRYKLNPVLGVGASAGSWVSPLKYSIFCTLDEYTKYLDNDKLPPFEGILLDQEEHLRRYLIHRFVLWGRISKKDFKDRFKKDADMSIGKKFKNILIDKKKNLVFLSNWKEELTGKYLKKYNDQELMLLFCLNNFFSPKIIKLCENNLKHGDKKEKR